MNARRRFKAKRYRLYKRLWREVMEDPARFTKWPITTYVKKQRQLMAVEQMLGRREKVPY